MSLSEVARITIRCVRVLLTLSFLAVPNQKPSLNNITGKGFRSRCWDIAQAASMMSIARAAPLSPNGIHIGDKAPVQCESVIRVAFFADK